MSRFSLKLAAIGLAFSVIALGGTAASAMPAADLGSVAAIAGDAQIEQARMMHYGMRHHGMRHHMRHHRHHRHHGMRHGMRWQNGMHRGHHMRMMAHPNNTR